MGPEQHGLSGDVKVVDHLPSSSCGQLTLFLMEDIFSKNISSDPNLKVFLISPAKVIEYLCFIVITRFKGF